VELLLERSRWRFGIHREDVKGASKVVKSSPNRLIAAYQNVFIAAYQNVFKAPCQTARREGKGIKVRETRCCSSVNLFSVSIPPKRTTKSTILTLFLLEISRQRLSRTTMPQQKIGGITVSDRYLIDGTIFVD
jgi:hypothetical protein